MLREIIGVALVFLFHSVAQPAISAAPAPEARESGAAPATRADYGAARGPSQVRTALMDWTDPARTRTVPIKAYKPVGADGPLPLVIFSHGAGGSREAGQFLCNHLASHGYVVLAVQHAGSDLAALRAGGRRPRQLQTALAAMVANEQNWRDRPADVKFVIDRALAGDVSSALKIDPQRIAVAGHSFGAYTAMAIAGTLVDLKDAPDTTFRDSRVKAVIALSPQGKGQFGLDDRSWERIAVPLLMMTGTKDASLKDDQPWTWRRQPFDALKSRTNADAGPFYLAVIDGAGHMAFADETNFVLDGLMGGRDPEFHGWIRQSCVAFLDAQLRREPAALEWFDARGIETVSRKRTKLESSGHDRRPAASQPQQSATPRAGDTRGTPRP